MIGLDRPLRPAWIYETLKMVEDGTEPSMYNDPFENITKELIGKEGKKKVRTIIFRSFIYSLQEGRNKIVSNIFTEWVQTRSLQSLKPLFLWKIIMDYEIARFTTRNIALCVDHSGHLSTPLLSKKLVQKYGDRDVVKRSLRSFLATLVHFGLLSRTDQNNYVLLPQKTVTAEQTKDFLQLYAISFLKSAVVDLQNIPTEFFFFVKPVELTSIAQEFNGTNWEYVREVERNVLIFKRVDCFFMAQVDAQK